MEVKNAPSSIETPEELISELKKSPNRKAWNVDPMRSPGYVVWYNDNGECLSCMTVEDNKKTHWGNFENFNKDEAEYMPEKRGIEYNNGHGFLKVETRNDSNLAKEIEDNESISQFIDLEDTVVGEIYLAKIS